ncbi:uncharacterized protein LOC106090974 isoform X1 [Stomoxys calcitrans]|uniref:uncharacterized protein LOC106090974 isoform X1 n=2 Tax=Stomoxys calcitrans TaxID=35570 RepID=UPI0027E3194F|nr:uncharacterized protein LOC106090974 isoform X1 [Stomoxys calcitrans]
MTSKSDRVANLTVWCKVSFVMAVCSIIMYMCLMANHITGLLLYYQIISMPEAKDESNEWQNFLTFWFRSIRVTNVYGVVAELILRITMFILSILLISGLKLHRHRFISPWLIMGVVIVSVELCIALFTVTGPIIIGLQTLMWFPVYTFYKKLRKTRYWKQMGFINTYTVWEDTKKFREWRSNIPSLTNKGVV